MCSCAPRTGRGRGGGNKITNLFKTVLIEPTIVSTVKEAVLRAVIEQHAPPPLGVVAILRAFALSVDSSGVVGAMLKLHHDPLAKGGPFAGEGVKERTRARGGGVTLAENSKKTKPGYHGNGKAMVIFLIRYEIEFSRSSSRSHFPDNRFHEQ